MQWQSYDSIPYAYLCSNSVSPRSLNAARSSGRGRETLPGICGKIHMHYLELHKEVTIIANLSVFDQLPAAPDIDEENGVVTHERILQLLHQSTLDYPVWSCAHHLITSNLITVDNAVDVGTEETKTRAIAPVT